MRIRFRNIDLQELARLYRAGAAAERRRAEELSASTRELFFLEQAARLAERAEKLERLARIAEDFVLMPMKPFDGGPPSLMVVGGSNAADGSAFVPKRSSK